MSDEFSRAVEALKAGKPVVFPTDTVFGLGISVKHARSLQAIYDIKQRDAGKPVAWLVDSIAALEEYGEDVPVCAKELVDVHWPGALTVIVKANGNVPAAFRSEAGTIGLRMPDNETVLKLIEAVGSPLAVSSANKSGCADASSVNALDEMLLREVAVVIQEDVPGGGVASTVIDCSQGNPVVVRQGHVVVS